MHTIAIRTETRQATMAHQSSLIAWFNQLAERTERNRFGIGTALILLQVSIAGFNVLIPAMAGASIWLMTPGIVLAFLANSVVMAQMKMKWVILISALSILVNAVISIYSVSLL